MIRIIYSEMSVLQGGSKLLHSFYLMPPVLLNVEKRLRHFIYLIYDVLLHLLSYYTIGTTAIIQF